MTTTTEQVAELERLVDRLRDLLGLNEKANRDEVIYIADAVSEREPFSELGRLTTQAFSLWVELRDDLPEVTHWMHGEVFVNGVAA